MAPFLLFSWWLCSHWLSLEFAKNVNFASLISEQRQILQKKRFSLDCQLGCHDVIIRSQYKKEIVKVSSLASIWLYWTWIRPLIACCTLSQPKTNSIKQNEIFFIRNLSIQAIWFSSINPLRRIGCLHLGNTQILHLGINLRYNGLFNYLDEKPNQFCTYSGILVAALEVETFYL